MIKKVFFGFYFCLTLVCYSQTEKMLLNRDWVNPAIFEKKQQEAHVPIVPFNTVNDALKYDKTTSPWYLSLNGTWKFNLALIPEDAPMEFFQNNYNLSTWSDIIVPANWQMQGYGHPLFRNVHQPFPANPPYPPTNYNPVGSYKREFTLPDDWNGRQILLHFEGVQSASYIWVNGQNAGYNQGGMEPAEYNITEYVHPGVNTLSVRVYCYSDGTYLEAQDMWRLAGIYRSVYIMAVPNTYIQDFYAWPDLDSKYKNGILKIETRIKNESETETLGYTLRIKLFTLDGVPVLSKDAILDNIAVMPGSSRIVKQVQKVNNPAKWSTEFPNLYTLVLELINQDNQVVQVVSNRIGFKKVEVKNQAIYVNGVLVKLNGVNSHMQHPVTGRAMDVETIKKDLILMKQFNINCVRTSHYPPNNEYLDLADELGMYIVDETGDEAHATEYISRDPAWRAAYLDRGKKIVLRDRNHPSVLLWSAGNESGSDENIGAIIEQGKKLDPSRPDWLYGGNTDLLPFEDIVGPRYPTPAELELVGQVPASQDKRPSFMDEYLAASGNSLGNLEEYWELIYKYPRLTGGAIWDWISPGLAAKAISTPDASRFKNDGYLMGNASLSEGISGYGLNLSGLDEWVEVYRDPSLNINGNKLTLETWVFPRRWNDASPFITKGDHQYGLLQKDKNTLEFYIYDGERISVTAAVPENWEYNWHHIAGVYNGMTLVLYVNKKQAGLLSHIGEIDYGYYPVNIGKNAELHGQEHPGQLCNAVLDNVRIYNRALTPEELGVFTNGYVTDAVLSLDFDVTEEKGDFYFLGIGARSYGLVWPDRTPQPELWQLKKTPQPVKITADDLRKGLFTFTNRHQFTNLSDFTQSWKISVEDSVVQNGTLQINLAPGSHKTVTLPYTIPELEAGQEAILDINFTLAQDKSWAAKGHEIAWEQFILPAISKKSMPILPSALSMTESDQAIKITGNVFTYTFGKPEGRLVSIVYKGKELLEKGPIFNAWRAPIANESERDWGNEPILNQWRSAGLDRLLHQVKNVSVIQKEDQVEIDAQVYSCAENNEAGFNNHYHYTFLGSGDIIIKHNIVPQGPVPAWLPKLGLQLELKKEFNRFSWYGRGPIETYPDRKTGARIGFYNGSVAEQYSPYLIPEDYGNKTDVRWAALTDMTGTGLLVSGSELFNTSVQEYDTDNLSRSLYTFQLVPGAGITMNIDYAVSGVGCTAVKTMEKYRVKPANSEYTIRLRPFYNNENSALELGRQRTNEILMQREK